MKMNNFFAAFALLCGSEYIVGAESQTKSSSSAEPKDKVVVRRTITAKARPLSTPGSTWNPSALSYPQVAFFSQKLVGPDGKPFENLGYVFSKGGSEIVIAEVTARYIATQKVIFAREYAEQKAEDGTRK